MSRAIALAQHKDGALVLGQRAASAIAHVRVLCGTLTARDAIDWGRAFRVHILRATLYVDHIKFPRKRPRVTSRATVITTVREDLAYISAHAPRLIAFSHDTADKGAKLLEDGLARARAILDQVELACTLEGDTPPRTAPASNIPPGGRYGNARSTASCATGVAMRGA
jgi:hypothetical protein